MEKTSTPEGNNEVSNSNVETSENKVDVSSTKSETLSPRLQAIKALEQANKESQKREMIKDRVEKVYNDSQKIASIDDIPEVGEFKGVDYKKVYESLPEDARKILANLKGDYTKKTQSLAEERKKLEMEKKSLMESDFYKNISKKSEEKVEVDPFDSVTIERRIEAEVAKRMKEMLEPVKQHREKMEKMARLESFKQENPDFDSLKVDIAKELTANKSLGLEQAYWIVKGRVEAGRTKSLEEENRRYREEAKKVGLEIGGISRGGKETIPEHIIKGGARAVYDYLEGMKKGKK